MRRWLPLFVVLTSSLGGGVGCHQLKLADHTLRCDHGACPSPYVCHADDYCYRLPEKSDASTDVKGDGSTAGVVDAAGDRSQATDTSLAPDGGTPGIPQLEVTIQRSGNGSVSGPGVTCTAATCTIMVDSGSNLVLQANAGGDSIFKTWSGCDTANDTSCSLASILSAKQVSVTFALKGANFVIVKDGNGSGSVAATWTGGGSLACGAACSGSVPQGTQVVLKATPDPGSIVTWGAPCTDSGACMLVTGAGETVAKATFTLSKITLSIAETGSGTVTGTGGISCAASACDAPVDYGTTVVLTATPAANYAVSGWTGCTTTNGNICTVSSIKAAAHVGVTFALGKIPLTLQRSGNGSITGSGNISCTDTSCTVQVDTGTTVTLQAVAGADSDFKGWSGCTPSVSAPATCTVAALQAAAQVSATFALKNASFLISRQGNGGGAVAASWPGGGALSCGAGCSANIAPGTTVTIQATPTAQSSVTWSFSPAGGNTCTGNGPCTVTVGGGGLTVTATFILAKYTLTVAAGGSGTVTGTGGINCTTFPCTTMLDAGASVTLTATAAAQYTFSGWSGCSSTSGATCTVTSIAAAANVTATFALKTYPITIQHSGNGSVTGTGGINCASATCVVDEASGSSVTLTAAPGADSNFTGWMGDCSGTSTCVLSSITAAKNVTATFALKSASFTISKSGNGSGTVSATWTGGGSLTCGANCSASITQGTQVTLTAMPSAGSTLVWGAPCSGAGTCVVTVAAGGTTIPATFTLGQFLLSVALAGPSSTGSVLSTTAGVGINCGTTCAGIVNYGTTVQLVATPSGSGAFSSWTGCDSVTTTTTCNVTITKATAVTAAFKRSNGNACGATSDCNSGFCVGGICCSTACPGIGVTNGCNVTCSSGTCQHSPPRTACGTIRPATYATITPGFNDIALMCDGAGNCAAPTITCNDTNGPFTCALGASRVCCLLATGMSTSDGFPIFNTGCGDPAKCGGIAVLWGQLCATTNDCPSGQICCEKKESSEDWSVCSTRAACTPGGDTAWAGQVCNKGAPDCLPGQSCSAGQGYYDLCQ